MFLYYINIVDNYIKTIYELQNEKDYFYHYKEFLRILDFVMVY